MAAPGATTPRRSLEGGRHIWDNRRAVNKTVVSSVFVVATALAGCQKSADLERVQRESLATVKLFGQQIEVEQRRADQLIGKAQQISGANQAGAIALESRSRLEQLRGLVQAAPQDLAAAAKAGKEAGLDHAGHALVESLDKGLVNARAELDAAERGIAAAERAQATRPAAPPGVDTAVVPGVSGQPASPADQARIPTNRPN